MPDKRAQVETRGGVFRCEAERRTIPMLRANWPEAALSLTEKVRPFFSCQNEGGNRMADDKKI